MIGRVDIITGTLGKAMGGASGGYVAARRRDRRAAAPALAAVPVLEQHRRRRSPAAALDGARPDRAAPTELRDALRGNTAHFRGRMSELGFDILPGDHPIVPVMLGDAALAGRLAAR